MLVPEKGLVEDVVILDYKSLYPTIMMAHNPVSYTHLRAHETVLDLVCRLLLEKKNLNVDPVLVRRLRH